MYRSLLATIAALMLAVLFGQAQSDAEEPASKSFSVHSIGQVQKKDGRNVTCADNYPGA